MVGKNLSWEDAVKRVTPDVQIGSIIWEDFKARLEEMYSLAKVEIDSGNVGGERSYVGEEIYIDILKDESLDLHISRIITYLMFLADCAALQEKTGWLVDVEYLKKAQQELSSLVENSSKELEGVMPPVARYVTRKPPKNPYKKNGELSASGEKWEETKKLLSLDEEDEWGNKKAKVVKVGEVQVLVKYDPPNINSSQQVKDFLFSRGWKPTTFKYVRDDKAFDEWVASKPAKGSFRGEWTEWNNSKPIDRPIPQVTKDGDEGKELCDSIEELASSVPEVKALENFSMVKHRLGVVEGFLSNMKDGRLHARVGGLASSLRLKHRNLVNLPATGKPFAESIRGSLVAGEGYVSIGSDLSSLESKVSHHFMVVHDPEYIKTLNEDGYDGHLAMAQSAGLISQSNVDDYKSGNKEGGWQQPDMQERQPHTHVNMGQCHQLSLRGLV